MFFFITIITLLLLLIVNEIVYENWQQFKIDKNKTNMLIISGKNSQH